MWWRVASFALALGLGGALGHGLMPLWWGGMAGMAAGGLLWLALDGWRALKLLSGLRHDRLSDMHMPGGLWGEAGNRARRLLRQRDTAGQEAQARLQDVLAAIQSSPNGVVLLDHQGHIEWCNQTAARHFGFDAERDQMQLIGNLVRDPAFAAYWARANRAQEVLIPGREHAPGRPVTLAVHLHAYGQGRSMLLSRDVTAVEQAEAMRRDFVANVSHEIRTPLTVLAGFVETLQTLPLNAEEQARYLGLMATQSHRMQSLVSDLLTLSRLEGSPLPGPGDWTPLRPLLVQCEADGRALSALLAKPPHDLQFDPGPEVAVAAMPTELLSAMSNLLSNAIRYTPAGGRITVRWALLADGRGEFSVVDSGPGIAPEHLPRLTERFYRVDRSRSRETGGTGLGLAIVKHVVQRHGGELRMASTLGQGATFTLVLPANRLRLQA